MQKKHLMKFNIYSWFKKKTLRKLEIEGNFLKMINTLYQKHCSGGPNQCNKARKRT